MTRRELIYSLYTNDSLTSIKRIDLLAALVLFHTYKNEYLYNTISITLLLYY